jgi:hypothetical protein
VKPINKNARRALREALLPTAVQTIVGIALSEEEPIESETVADHALELADVLAVKALGYDAVIERREREERTQKNVEQRAVRALEHNIKKVNKADDSDAAVKGSLT